MFAGRSLTVGKSGHNDIMLPGCLYFLRVFRKMRIDIFKNKPGIFWNIRAIFHARARRNNVVGCYFVADFNCYLSLNDCRQFCVFRRRTDIRTAVDFNIIGVGIRPNDHAVVNNKLFRRFDRRVDHAQITGISEFSGNYCCCRGFGTDQINIGIHCSGSSEEVAVGCAQRYRTGFRALAVADAKAAGIFHQPCTRGD